MINRREMVRRIAAGATTMSFGGAPAFAEALASIRSQTSFRRIVFFLQNHGFNPLTCVPKDVQESCSLDSFKLEEPMRILEPYKDRMNVLLNMHGTHTAPHHSAYFGALGGFRGGYGTPPVAATIDATLGGYLPECIFPMLSIGMDSLDAMIARPTEAALSASGPAKPVDMDSHPTLLYQKVFGSIVTGDLKDEYLARSAMLKRLERFASSKAVGLPNRDASRYAEYVDGYHSTNTSREKLAANPELLQKFAPKMDDRYTNPQAETDWHDALLEIGLAALQAGLTNVLTIGSGRGGVGGAWHGLEIETQGHSLGHMPQPRNDTWLKIRQYNCQMLVKLIKGLEAVPEGQGNMMEHTLIVYTSNNGAKQHTSGTEWPFVLIGNAGGTFKTGRLIHCQNRPLNDLYTTLLRGAGVPVDHFNFKTPSIARDYNSHGPIEELFA